MEKYCGSLRLHASVALGFPKEVTPTTVSRSSIFDVRGPSLNCNELTVHELMATIIHWALDLAQNKNVHVWLQAKNWELELDATGFAYKVSTQK